MKDTLQTQKYIQKPPCFRGSEYLIGTYQNNKKSKIPLYSLSDDRSQVLKFMNSLVSKPYFCNIFRASHHSWLKLPLQIHLSFI